MKWLTDTNVLSELVRPRPNPGVLAWAADIERLSVSVVTLEEILFGLAWKPTPKVQQWFEKFFAEACESSQSLSQSRSAQERCAVNCVPEGLRDRRPTR